MREDRERWERKWSRQSGGPEAPEPWIVANAALLPAGRLLDVAAGRGRHALHLAARRWQVTALDIAPSALAGLRERALAAGLAVDCAERDLDEPEALAGLGPFEAMVVACYRPDPAQWRRLAASLVPGGAALLLSFGREKAAQGFPERFCLDEDWLRATLAGLLECERYERLGPAHGHLEGSLWRRPGAR